MDAQALRRVLRDFFRFNPKDFYVQSSPTGFLVSIAGQNSSTPLGQLQLFKKDNNTIGITAGGVAGLPYDGTTLLDVTGEDHGTVYAQVDVSSDMAFSNLSIYDNGTSDPPALDPTHANQLLGSYTRDTDGVLSVHPMVDGSQGLSVCFADPTTGNVIPTWVLV